MCPRGVGCRIFLSINLVIAAVFLCLVASAPLQKATAASGSCSSGSENAPTCDGQCCGSSCCDRCCGESETCCNGEHAACCGNKCRNYETQRCCSRWDPDADGGDGDWVYKVCPKDDGCCNGNCCPSKECCRRWDPDNEEHVYTCCAGGKECKSYGSEYAKCCDASINTACSGGCCTDLDAYWCCYNPDTGDDDCAECEVPWSNYLYCKTLCDSTPDNGTYDPDECYLCDGTPTNGDGADDSCYLCDSDGNGSYDDCYLCDSTGDNKKDDCYLCDHDNDVPGNDDCFRCSTLGTPVGTKTQCYLCDNDGQNGNDDCQHTFDYTGASGYHVKCYDCDINGDGTMDSGIDEEIDSYFDISNCAGTRIQTPGLAHVYDGCSAPLVGSNPCGLFPNPNTDFTACCNEHDEDYQTCDYSRLLADQTLRDCMLGVCNQAGNPWCTSYIVTCNWWAYQFYDQLRLWGWIAYEGRQVEYCECCLSPVD